MVTVINFSWHPSFYRYKKNAKKISYNLELTLLIFICISYNNVNYSHHTVHYMPNNLSYNWKLVPFGHLSPIPCPPTPGLCKPQINIFFDELYDFVSCFLDTTYK